MSGLLFLLSRLSIVFLFAVVFSSSSFGAVEDNAEAIYLGSIVVLKEKGYSGIDEAIAGFRRSLEISNDYGEAHLAMVNAYLLKYEFTEKKNPELIQAALNHCNFLLERKQFLEEVYLKKAILYLNLNKLKETQHNLEKLLELQPTDTEGQRLYIKLLLNTDQKQLAVEKVSAWFNNNEIAQEYFQVYGALFYSAQLYEYAIYFYINIVDLANNPIAFMQLGKCFQEQGEYEQAADVFTRMLELYPDKIEAHFLLALCYSNLDMADQSIKQFEFFRKSYPENIPTLKNLAILYEKKGNNLYAKLMWLKIKQLADNPEHKEIAGENIERLLKKQL